MRGKRLNRPLNVLLVEDNRDDVDLTFEALRETDVDLRIAAVEDGVEALEYLHRTGRFAAAPRPDLVLLDLNLRRKDGREVLAEIKGDATTRTIPIIVLTTSNSEDDVRRAYEHHANCYITKPMDLNEFIEVLKAIEYFWLTVAELPR